MAKKMEKAEDKRTVLSEDGVLEFYKLYDVCVDKIEKNISKKEFHDFLDKNVIVSEYISLGTKKNMIDLFYAMNTGDDEYFTNMTYMFEIYSILFMLFTYTNIHITDEEINENNYDVVMRSGLADYIKTKIGQDYTNFYNMVLNSNSFRAYQLINMFDSSLDINELKDFAIKTEKALTEVDKEKLSLLSSIVEFNNPALKKINDYLHNDIERFNTEKE